MDQNALERREKLLKLQEELLAVEQDRLAGRSGCTLEELEPFSSLAWIVVSPYLSPSLRR